MENGKLILDSFSLKGKVALVTGSSRGLGAGIALALAEAGADVVLHGTTSVPQEIRREIAAAGVRTAVVTGDVSDPIACRALVDEAIAAFGDLNILVNNAGTIRRSPAVDHP